LASSLASRSLRSGLTEVVGGWINFLCAMATPSLTAVVCDACGAAGVVGCSGVSVAGAGGVSAAGATGGVTVGLMTVDDSAAKVFAASASRLSSPAVFGLMTADEAEGSVDGVGASEDSAGVVAVSSFGASDGSSAGSAGTLSIKSSICLLITACSLAALPAPVSAELLTELSAVACGAGLANVDSLITTGESDVVVSALSVCGATGSVGATVGVNVVAPVWSENAGDAVGAVLVPGMSIAGEGVSLLAGWAASKVLRLRLAVLRWLLVPVLV
jgi:hypothetical protein